MEGHPVIYRSVFATLASRQADVMARRSLKAGGKFCCFFFLKEWRGTLDDTDLDEILSTVIFLSLLQPFFPVSPARAGNSSGSLPFLFFFFGGVER